MTAALTLSTGVTAKSVGLEVWMDRALKEAEKVRTSWSPPDIHDLRVALRRCRTMADALNQVNPDPGWRKLKKSTRGLFHALGELRDTQVERSWVKRLGLPGDLVRRQMLMQFARQERKQRRTAEQTLESFDRKEWRKWSRKLSAKSRFFPLESVVFQRLALAGLNDAVGLYQKARKRRDSAAWHRLRIGIKRFRYIVENFLPQRYEVWAEDLKRMQDLLGEVHDLDVLRSEIRSQEAKFDPAVLAPWLDKIAIERRAQLQEFLSKTTHKDSPWIVWRAGFQWGHALVAASFPQRRTA
jgi:CHAD domain-containing protein